MIETAVGVGGKGLWIEAVLLVSSCCTLPRRVDGHHWPSSIPWISHVLAPSATPRDLASAGVLRGDGNTASLGEWPPRCRLPARADGVPQGTQRLRVQDQGNSARRRTSAVVWHEEGWAPPYDTAQDMSREEDNEWRKLVAKSSVMPQRSARLRDR